MEPLVRWLLGGFVVSLLFIAVARWFWKRYDQPSEAALEWQKEQEEKRKERKVWESEAPNNFNLPALAQIP